MENERALATALGFFRGSSAIVSTANPVAVVDTQPVPAGIFWHVERASLQLLFINAAAPANGDLIGLYVCPPGTPAFTQGTGGGAGQIRGQIADDQIIVEEMDAALASSEIAANGAVIAAGGAGAFLVTLRNQREFLVPSQWFVRAVFNGSGDAGGPNAASTLYLSLQYGQLENC